MSNSKQDSGVTEFLIAEFNALQERAISLEQRKSNRVNFFLVVTAAVVAGSANLIDNMGFQAYRSAAVALAAFSLLVLGTLTLQQCIDDSVSIVAFYRRAGRIRLWFVECDVKIEPYVAFHYGDDRPRMYVSYLAFRGGEAAILVTNVVLFCAIIIALFAPASWSIALIEIIIASLLAWFLQVAYVRGRLQRAEEIQEAVHFPHESMVERVTSVSNQK
jgi:hypothetical protein